MAGRAKRTWRSCQRSDRTASARLGWPPKSRFLMSGRRAPLSHELLHEATPCRTAVNPPTYSTRPLTKSGSPLIDALKKYAWPRGPVSGDFVDNEHHRHFQSLCAVRRLHPYEPLHDDVRWLWDDGVADFLTAAGRRATGGRGAALVFRTAIRLRFPPIRGGLCAGPGR